MSDAEVRAYLSRLWADAWDCPEDSAYDSEPPQPGQVGPAKPPADTIE